MDNLPHTVLEALKAGNKIEAIKQLRTLTGLGLRAAKDKIDAYERGAPLPMAEVQPLVTRNPEASFAHFDKAVAALKAGNTTDAIRIIKMASGMGLAEVKSMVERMQKEMPAAKMAHSAAKIVESLRAGPGLAPGEVPHGGGSGKWLVLVAIAIVAISAALYA